MSATPTTPPATQPEPPGRHQRRGPAPTTFTVPRTLLTCAVLTTALVGGLLATSPWAGPIVLGIFLTMLGIALARLNRGVFVGAVLLVILNGIPFLDLESATTIGKDAVVKTSPFRDPGVFILFVVLLFWNRGWWNRYRHDPWFRHLTVISSLLIGWWGVTLLRSVAVDHIPIVQAALFGRDYLAFALLLPLLPVVVRDRREVAGLVGTLGLGALIFAVGVVLLTGFNLPTTQLVHPHIINSELGVQRVYSSMTDLVTLGLTVSIGVGLLSRKSRSRWAAAVLALIFGSAIAMQLTRALYLAIPVGIIGVTLVSMMGTSDVSRILRQRVLVMTISAAIIIIGFAIQAGGINSTSTPVTVIAQRAASTLGDYQAGSGTVAIRQDLAGSMLEVLGPRWPVGLGFWHPSSHYVATLPAGSIRNPDTGALNLLMTMGLVGCLLLYATIGYGILTLLRRFKEHADTRLPDWLSYGLAAWLIVGTVASVTLVQFHSMGGLVLTAVVLAIAGSSYGRLPTKRA